MNILHIFKLLNAGKRLECARYIRQFIVKDERQHGLTNTDDSLKECHPKKPRFYVTVCVTGPLWVLYPQEQYWCNFQNYTGHTASKSPKRTAILSWGPAITGIICNFLIMTPLMWVTADNTIC